MPDTLYHEAPRPNFRITYGNHPSNFIDIRLPRSEPPYPTAIVIHGGFWKSAYNLKQTGHICASLASAGIATCNVEFRRVGHASGGWPTTFEDLRLAMGKINENVTRYGFDRDRIVLIGHSSGAHLAFWLGGEFARCREVNATSMIVPAGLVSLAGVFDLVGLWHDSIPARPVLTKLLGGSLNELEERYRLMSPTYNLPNVKKQLLVHGLRDRVVPYNSSRAYFEKSTRTGKDIDLLTLKTGHFSLLDPASGFWTDISGAILKVLKR